jgi:hypothetical protein
MQVTVDQASGDTSIDVFIPYSDAADHFVSGNEALPHSKNISISNRGAGA